MPGARAIRRRALALLAIVPIRRYRPVTAAGDAGDADDSPPTLAIRLDLILLETLNRVSFRKVTSGTSDVVVTMTTHGSRIKTVHLALESIARGTRRPSRLILWLDDETLASNLPRSLRRLKRRGLEVVLVENGYKVHTKYYFYVQSIQHHARSLLTSDDDIVYPRRWLQALEAAHAVTPDYVICYRAHSIQVAADGLALYDTWTPCSTSEPSFRTFGTSVSGQLFPAGFLDYVRSQGDSFKEITPDADDVWLHSLAVHSGVRVSQLGGSPILFPFVPGTQASGLYLTNFWDGGNDRQIAKAYSASDVERIRSDDSRRGEPPEGYGGTPCE